MAERILVSASYGPSLLNFRGPLLAALIAHGHDVHVCAPTITADDQRALQDMGVHVHVVAMQRTGMNPLQDLKYCVALVQLICRMRCTLFVSYTIKPNIWGAIAASVVRVPSVAIVTGLGYAFTDAGAASPKTKIVKFISRMLYKFAANRNWRIIFQNPDDRDDFMAARCLNETKKVRMVNGSGVDLAHFTVAPLPSAPVFLMISRLLHNKGVREYGEAAIAVKQTYPNAQFLLVGYMEEGPDGIAQSELDHWVANGLEYLGPQTDVRPAIRQSRIYVLPSYREGTPRSVLEAMAMGRAIITTDAPGCRETVENGVNGQLVPVQSVEAVQNAMLKMITAPADCAAMGVQSLRIAQEKYDINKVNETMLRHFGLL